jgi:hypothetical protein
VNLKEIGNCAACRYADVCGGGCRARAFAHYRSLYAVDPLCPFNPCNISEELSKNRPEVKVQERQWETFSLKIGSTLLRVRKEDFGGTVYIPGREQQIYVNEDGYTLVKILLKTQDVQEIIKELKKENRYITEKYVEDFLNELAESVRGATARSGSKDE